MTEVAKLAAETDDDFYDKHARWIVRGTIIGTGLLGVAVLARSIRMFTTFQHARQIPGEFFHKQMRLRGTVAHVADNGVLRVQHIPIFKMPLSKYFGKPSKDQGKLSVHVAGVEITESGREWLKQHLLWRPVWITLIRRYDQDSIECEVLGKKGRFFKYNVNKELVRRGLARIPGMESKDHVFAFKTNAAYSRLIQDLIISEKYADKRGVGLWERPSWFESYMSYVSQRKETFANSFVYKILLALGKFAEQFFRMAAKQGRIAAGKGLELTKQLKDNYKNTSRN